MSRSWPTLAALLLLLSPPLTIAQVVYGEQDALPLVPAATSPLGTNQVEYLYDNGTGNTNIGPPSTFDPDMLWGNYFLTQPGGEVITEIRVAFGPTFPSLDDGPVTFWLLDDPDMDLDPQNATALVSVQGTPDVFGNTFFHVTIPPTQVSGAFFVGASAQLQGGQDRPARVDTSHPGDRSWFFYAPDISEVINDLASAPFGTRMDNAEYVPFPGAFMIRAIGVPAPASPDLGNAYIMPHSGTQSIMLFDGETGDLIDEHFITFTEHSGVPIHAILNFDRGGIFVSVQAGTTGNVVYEYDLDGTFHGVFAPKGGQNLDILQNIRGMSLDPTGTRLWVTVGGGANGGGIAEFDMQGNYLGNFVEPDGSPMGRPWSILIRESDVLVTDEVDDGVHRFDLDGTYLGLWSQTTLNNPHQIAPAANGNVLVAGFSLPSGAFEFQPGGQLHAHYTARPSLRGISELPNGNLLVSSPTGVFEITREDELVRTIVTGQARHITRIDAATLSFTPSTLHGEVAEGETSQSSFTMHNNMQGEVGFEFTQLPEFISVISPAMGTLDAETAVEVTVTFDGTVVPGGVHEGTIVVETDELDNGLYEYPVVLNVIGAHQCVIDPDPVAFGGVILGFDATLEVTLTNEGTGPCPVTAVTTDEDDFTADLEVPVTLQPGESTTFNVTFAPTTVGEVPGTLTLAVDDAADVTAALQGVGLAPPVASVKPSFVEMEVSSAEPEATATLALSNLGVAGAADLEYTIALLAVDTAARPTADHEGASPRRLTAGSHGARPVARHGGAPGRGPFPQTEFGRGDGDELILDGSFEAGTPNPYWEEFSSNFGTPLCDIPGCAPFNPDFNPHTGDWWLWFGGHNTEQEVGYVEQEVTIPAGPAELSFFLQIPTADGTGFMRVLIDEAVVFDVTEADAGSFPVYTQVTVDVSAFADETPRTVRFESTTDPPGVTNFFIDDVSLISTGRGILAVDPTMGSVPAGGSAGIVLTAMFDEDVEPGVYPYELRIHTNDPDTPVLVVDVTVTMATIGTGDDAGPLTFALEQNYPNPFSGETAITFSLAEPSAVRIDVYDLSGRRVVTVVDGDLEAGAHTATWDATGLASGAYLYRIQAGRFTQTRRALVVN